MLSLVGAEQCLSSAASCAWVWATLHFAQEMRSQHLASNTGVRSWLEMRPRWPQGSCSLPLQQRGWKKVWGPVSTPDSGPRMPSNLMAPVVVAAESWQLSPLNSQAGQQPGEHWMGGGPLLSSSPWLPSASPQYPWAPLDHCHLTSSLRVSTLAEG